MMAHRSYAHVRRVRVRDPALLASETGASTLASLTFITTSVEEERTPDNGPSAFNTGTAAPQQPGKSSAPPVVTRPVILAPPIMTVA